jgi:endonuclease/exonuclease/phosphatase family metal-dependent hydrolase
MIKNSFLFVLVVIFSFKDFSFKKNHQENKSDLKILTWNIQNLGRTKNNQEIAVMAQIIKNYDIIGIQEITAKDPAGAQAVAKIVDALNRLGNKWDYTISNPTKSPSNYISERYAFIWKTSKLKLLKKAFLDASLENVIDREPYLAQFEIKKNKTAFYFINIHARVYNKNPEMEIAYFKKYPEKLKTDSFVILGDFNLNEKHNVWNPLYKKGFQPAIKNTATTLKRICKNGEYKNHPIDNIYFNTRKMKSINSGIIDFVNECENLTNARFISDHLPVFLEVIIP